MSWRAFRLWRRAAMVGALVALVLLGGSSTASAHSYFIQSDPPDGSMVEKAPRQVVLVFSSAVAANFSKIELIEAGGSHYTPSSVKAYPTQPNIVVVSLPEIPKGSYRLTFATRDSLDFHITAGTIVFGVGVAPPASTSVPKPVPPQPWEVVMRWIALSGLAGLLGAIVLALGVIDRLPEPEGVRARLQRGLFGLALIGTALVLIGQTGLLLVQASSLGSVGASIGGLLAGSEFGTRYLITLFLVAGLTPFLLHLWTVSKGKPVSGLLHEFRELKAWFLLSTQARVVLLCAGLVVAMAFSGHVAGASGTSVGGVTLLSLHIGAMGVWAGGVAALALTLFALRRATGQLERKSVMAMVVGFGQIAGVAFATLGITGLLLSGLQVASITALLSTQYGAVLIGKVVLIGVVALVALRHALLTWRGLGPTFRLNRLPRLLPLTIAIEAVGALAVVLFASVLGASAPAQGPQFAPPSSATPLVQLTRQEGDLLITLSVKPNRSGPNLVSVAVATTRWPATPPSQVTMLLRRPGDLSAGESLATTPSSRPAGASFGATNSATAFDAGTVKLNAGDVRFTIMVQRQGLGDKVAIVPWHVAPLPVTPAPVVLSNQQLAPMVNPLAIVSALIALVFIIGGALRKSSAGMLRQESSMQRGSRRRLVFWHVERDAPISTPQRNGNALEGTVQSRR